MLPPVASGKKTYGNLLKAILIGIPKHGRQREAMGGNGRPQWEYQESRIKNQRVKSQKIQKSKGQRFKSQRVKSQRVKSQKVNSQESTSQ